ncbi:MAG: T9SS type A sorting domain-containing protein [Leptolyngbya sp. SIO3F4]|nr:T9SS type A sorting domain-containing protein [Leptolyngbya sp. SIO3F4]
MANNRAYNYWSSPLADESIEDVFSASNTADFYSYNNAWSSATGTMTPGMGYAATNDIGASYPTAFTKSFSGSNLNNGSFTLSGLGTDYADWVLIGNPYPSPLFLDSLEANNANLSSTFWFWNHQTSGLIPDSTQDYATFVVGVGGTAALSALSFVPDGVAAVGQGFMAQLTSGSSISFANTQRSDNTQMDFFKSRNTPEDRHLIWMGLLAGNHSNQILIGFVPDGEKGVGSRDGKKLKGSQTLAFYSLVGSEELAIQGLPQLPINTTEEIPLGVDVWNPGSCTIRVDSIFNLPSNYEVWLEDKQEGIFTNLQSQPVYTFDVTQAGIDHQRFALIVKHTLTSSGGDTPVRPQDSLTTHTEEPAMAASLRTFQNQQELHVVLEGSHNAQLSSIQVYDLHGRVLFDVEQIHRKRISIPVSSFATGIYYVVTTTQRGETFTSKTFIQQ